MKSKFNNSTNRTLVYCVDDNNLGQRLDNFLLSKIKTVPKSHIYKIIRKGMVRVNNKRKRPNYHLCGGDIVRVPPLILQEVGKKIKPSNDTIEAIENQIIYENGDFLVVNKPPGMATHGGSGINFGVIETLRAARADAPYLELVHRLDRDTSGCLIIAKKRSFLRYIHELIRNFDITKNYIALLKGKLEKKIIEVDASLVKNVSISGERYVKVNDLGKKSITIFKKIKNIGNIATLVEVSIKTGRTHQIRVHAAHLGHPVAGDDKYGDKEFNQFMKSKGLNRLFLHAASLKFIAADKNTFEITSGLDDKLKEVVSNLEEFYD